MAPLRPSRLARDGESTPPAPSISDQMDDAATESGRRLAVVGTARRRYPIRPGPSGLESSPRLEAPDRPPVLLGNRHPADLPPNAMSNPTTDGPFSQSIYRIVRSVNRAYAFAVLWCYIAAFVVAFALMFVFPPGTLLLVFLGVFGLVAAVGGAQILGGIEHLLARRLIRQERCPACGMHRTFEPITRGRSTEASGADRERHAPETSGRLGCNACGAAYERWGGEIESVSSMALIGALGSPGLGSGGLGSGGIGAAGLGAAGGASGRRGPSGRGGSSITGASEPQ